MRENVYRSLKHGESKRSFVKILVRNSKMVIEHRLNQQSKSKVCLLKQFHGSMKVLEVHLKWKFKVQFMVKDQHETAALIEVSIGLL